MIKQIGWHDQQYKKDVIFLILMKKISKTPHWNRNIFNTFTTQKLNKNKIRLFHILLVIFFLCSLSPFSSITPSNRFSSSWPAWPSDRCFWMCVGGRSYQPGQNDLSWRKTILEDSKAPSTFYQIRMWLRNSFVSPFFLM